MHLCALPCGSQVAANTTSIFPVQEPIHGGYYTYTTASDAALVQAIRRSHALGLQVMLKPQVDLLNDASHWRGDIGYSFNASDWEAWFDSYSTMLLHYASLAEGNGVEVLAVSTELITACVQGPESSWRGLIKQVRSVFSGTVTNAANWGWLDSRGGQATNMTWWDAVDFIGIDAYYDLNTTANSTLPELVQAWAPVITRLQNLTQYWSMPVAFTEIGYCSTDCKRSGPPVTAADLAFQAQRYEAALAAFEPYYTSWFHGMFWWAWSTDPGSGGAGDRCITPAYKPAEGILREFWGADPDPGQPPVPPTCPCTV